MSGRCASCWRSCCGAKATRCCSPRTAARRSTLLEREPVDLLISDIKMPDLSGVDVLRAAKQIDQDILGIMITAFASTETAVEAMRLGACDYLSKPFDIDLLKMKVREKIENRQLRQENVLLKRTLGLSHQFSNIIGRSEAMLDVFKMIETVARTNSTILLTGESGTGKGLVAQAIHFHSLRRDKPMVVAQLRRAAGDAARVGAVRPHARRVHRRRQRTRRGCSKSPSSGTIFLDEIGEMSAGDAGEAAARAAGAAVPARRRPRGAAGRHPRHRGDQPGSDEGWSPRAGSARTSSTGSTSSRSRCRRCASAARTSRCSPSTSWRSTASRWARTITGISHEAMELLQRHDWPGNIRELENVIERAVALEATPTILPDSLPPSIRGDAPRVAGAASVDGAARSRLRSRSARQGDRARLHRRGAEAGGRRAGEGRGAARHELPVVPLLREEIQPALTTDLSVATDDSNCQSATDCQRWSGSRDIELSRIMTTAYSYELMPSWHPRCSRGRHDTPSDRVAVRPSFSRRQRNEDA